MKILRLLLPSVLLAMAVVACEPDSHESFQITNNSDSTFTVVTKLHANGFRYSNGDADTSYWVGDTLRVSKYRLPKGGTAYLFNEDVFGSPDFDNDESAHFFFERYVADDVSLDEYTLSRSPMVMSNWQRTIQIYRNGNGNVEYKFVITNSDLSAAK